MNNKELLIDFIEYAKSRHVMPILHSNIEPLIDDYLHQQNLQQCNVSGSLPQVDWTILRQKYFSDCTIKDSVDGMKLRIDYAPHDLFEWFKREIQFGGNDGNAIVIGALPLVSRDELISSLEDKRICKMSDLPADIYYLSRKETADYLMDNYLITKRHLPLTFKAKKFK